MEREMAPNEIEELKQALISAFPHLGSLEQMVAFKLGENLQVIVGGANYGELVFNLIRWAEANGKTEKLIAGARKENQGNPRLREFAERYKLHRDGNLSTSSVSHLTAQLRLSLVETLLRIPLTSSHQGRSMLLTGIPNSPALERSDTIARLDLERIIDQLDNLGRLSSGEWPLLILIDNALPHIAGLSVGDELQAIRQTLVKNMRGDIC